MIQQPSSASASASFPRSARLLQAAQFSEVLQARAGFARARRFSAQLLVLSWLSQPTGNPEPETRLGLITGKKQAPRAVTRNTVRRVCREWFRLHRHVWPRGHYVLRLQTKIAPDTSLTALKEALRSDLVQLEAALLAKAQGRP